MPNNIYVLFEKGNEEPYVKSDVEVLDRRESVNWHLMTDDDDIDWFEIEFEEPWAKFFEPPDATKFGKERAQNETTRIWGTVPIYGHLTDPKIAKYTVRGRSGGPTGKVVQEADPKIVTPKP